MTVYTNDSLLVDLGFSKGEGKRSLPNRSQQERYGIKTE